MTAFAGGLQLIVMTFLGPPGSGKGTLAARCAQELQYTVLSTGDLCRKHVALGTEIGILIENYINKGQLVPDEIITKMVREWLKPEIERHRTIILDGYPRRQSQAALFVDLIQKGEFSFRFKGVIFDVSDEEVVRRLTNRLVCTNKECQAIYSTLHTPPEKLEKCEKCQSPLAKRADDEESVIRERLAVYATHKAGIMQVYEEKGIELIHLQVDGKTPDQVFDSFQSMIGTKRAEQ